MSEHIEKDGIEVQPKTTLQVTTAAMPDIVPTIQPQIEGMDPEQESIEDNDERRYSFTSRQLTATYILIWFIQFAIALSYGTSNTLIPYVTSDFQKHALTATTTVVASIASGLMRLPYAKILDIWGRPHGLAFMLFFMTIGTVMMAACQNVETYCAAQVFYNVGYWGIQFSLIIFITDSIPLHNRAFVMGWISTPTMASPWIYGPATERILDTIGFRWGFGIWSIIIPIICSPLIVILFKFDKKIHTVSTDQKTSIGGSKTAVILHYIKEFDVVGLLLLSTGLCLLLLSFSINSYQSEGWRSPMIICFIIFGVVLILSFALYERYLAPKTFIPWPLIRNRTVILTNAMAATLYTAEFMTNAYLYSLLIVVFNQSVTQATYINNIYFVGATFWMLILGVAFRYYGHIKHYALVLGIPFFILGTGLMIKFRTPDTPIGLMVLCEILIAFGGGTMYPIEQMTLMAVSQDDIVALLAVEAVTVDTGKAAGSAIATSIWTGMFQDRLRRYLPADAQPYLEQIYGSLYAQISYPVGSLERVAISQAYGDTQRIILIAATSLLGLTWLTVLLWPDIDVRQKRRRQN